MNSLEIKLAKQNGTINELYEQLVVEKVREKYSASEETAILRKKLANIDTKDEFTTFNAYVEQCKVDAKTELGIE